MKKKVTYIPTLQEFVKKRKKERTELSELKDCSDCDYYRHDMEVCLWGNTLRTLSSLNCCPVTYRDLSA